MSIQEPKPTKYLHEVLSSSFNSRLHVAVSSVHYLYLLPQCIGLFTTIGPVTLPNKTSLVDMQRLTTFRQGNRAFAWLMEYCD